LSFQSDSTFEDHGDAVIFLKTYKRFTEFSPLHTTVFIRSTQIKHMKRYFHFIYHKDFGAPYVLFFRRKRVKLIF